MKGMSVGLAAIFSGVVTAAACGGKGGGECAPLEVKVDGQAVQGLKHAYAITQTGSGNTLHQVQIFNHEETCANLTARSRTVPDGEEAFRAFAGGSGTFGKGVGIDAHTQLGVDVELMTDVPKNPGDKVAVCVPPTTFKPVAGRFKDKEVSVKGKLEGAFCGVQNLDAK